MKYDKSNFQVVRNHYIVGNFFPKDIADMRAYPNLKFSGDIYLELRWRSYIFNYYSAELSELIKFRKDYDKAVLLGNYEGALKILKKVKNLYGISFWYMESIFFVYKKLGKDFRVIYEKEEASLNKTILSYFGLKNRENMTCNEYEQVINREMNNLHKVASENNRLKDLIPYFNYRIMPLTFDVNEQNVLDILKQSSSDSLIDQYLLMLDIFDFAMNIDKKSIIYNAVKESIKVLLPIQDEHLNALKFVFDSNRYAYVLNKNMQEAKNCFINNELIKCREMSIKILFDEPYNVQALNLLVESNILLKKEETEFKGTILGDLVNALTSVYPMNHNRDENIDILFKYLNCCSQSEWANFISKTVNTRCNLIGTREEVSERKKSSMQYLDIETVYNCLSVDEAIDFINLLKMDDDYTKFRKMIVIEEFDKAELICKLDVLKLFMRIRNKKYSLADKLEFIKSAKKRGSTVELMITNCYISQIDLDKNLVEAIEFATDTLIDNIFTSLFIPIQIMVEEIEKCDINIWNNICVSILYYMKYRYYDKQSKSEVCAKTEDFLYFTDINIPSNIEQQIDFLGIKRVIYFLRNVCTQEILSTALASQIDNSKDLAQERINICWVLCKLDSDSRKEYENEIRNITQKGKIDSELRIIQENRINVNIEGIRSDLIEIHNGDFMRYKLYQDNSINDILKAIIEKQDKVILYENDADRVLRKLVDNIRDAFVSSNEYGLDGYLSLNIRHGAISDALRTPLSKAGLLAIYNVDYDDYSINTGLLNTIIGEEDKKKLINSIVDFTNKTDEIIDDLRNRYIRIRKKDIYPEGVFDYNISELEYDIIRRKSDEFFDFEELLTFMFDFLWEKTEKNLNSMKLLLQNDISERYKEAFIELQNSIEKFENTQNIPVLKRRILEVSDDMSTTIKKIEFWFQRNIESKNTDFDLDFVFNLGLETIISMHPEVNFVPNRMSPKCNSEKIEGRYLKLYSDIFYNLLDNIYKNAKREKNCIEFEYLLEQKDGKQYIFLQNQYDCSGNMDKEHNKVKELKELLSSRKYLDRVGAEGGTGIPKICKIISIDLKRIGKIEFDFLKEENKFFIEIVF
jgi:hypothetical protein